MLRIAYLSTVLCLVALVTAQRASQCSSDADCMPGCCHTDHLHGSKCYPFQNISEPCHLPNHHVNVLLYPCGCMQGLTCDEIHFDPSLPDSVHQAELLLLGHGYGLCTDTPGTVFGK